MRHLAVLLTHLIPPASQSCRGRSGRASSRTKSPGGDNKQTNAPQAEAACHAREIAEAASAAGADGLHDIRDLGSRGKHSQNVWRGFRTVARRSLKTSCPPFFVDTVVTASNEFICAEGKRAVLLPHEIASKVWTHNEHAFHEVFGTQHVTEFWNRYIECHPEFRSHPAYNEVVREPQYFIPCKMFEDAGGVGKHRGIQVAEWSPLLSCKPTLDAKFPMYALEARRSLGDATTKSMIDVLVWSWHVCLTGVWPDRDAAGSLLTGQRAQYAARPLCGRYKLILLFVTMDWKAAVEAFNFEWNYNTAPSMCHLCDAEIDGVKSYAQFHLRHDFWNPRCTISYLGSCCAQMSPWSRLPGFTLASVVAELMHNNPLGVCLYAGGSVLLELCEAGHFGHHDYISLWKDRLNLQLASAYVSFRRYLRRRGLKCRTRKFNVNRLTMQVRDDCPVLKCKASPAMHVVDWLAHESAKQSAASVAEYSALRATMIWSLSTFNRIVRCSSWPFMTTSELSALRSARDGFFATYHQLRLLASEQVLPWYPIVPKFHMLSHCEDYCQKTGLCPRLLWTFSDEDCMGLVQKIALSSHNNTIDETVLVKWTIQWFTRHLPD